MRGVLLALALTGCATQAPPEEPCFVTDQATARAIAAAVSGQSPDDDSLQVADEGDHWRVGRYAETWLEDDMIRSRDAGFTLRIDKCSGAISYYRTWG